ncbi:transcriptional regulator [Methyloceanibacter stevinii]|uniref:Transcriptional regulator n=1 Tax=Methyloceanibacter stevinii TaxID=1774970 RepID=A0A1E3VUM0_9HYPH|nr:helix-turn-helix domain-containing protein [Methyloceanibacter stevinii]ODR97250.1 transcriptional regulator [Methyloceanibacter stevinii]
MDDSRSGCPIAMTLDIVGDRWTLVILRDLLMGKRRFSQFLESPERVATNVLTDRLALMEREGLVTKTLYQERPKRYEYRLSEKGEALLPVLQAMARWGNRFIPSSWPAPEEFLDLKAP